MKLQKLSLAIALVAAMGASASAAERPSQATLEAMGLGGMSIVSDADAVSIRGMGYSGHKSKSSARAWGSSYASIHSNGASASSRNGYDSKGKHIAAGANLSVAGAIIISGGGGGGGGVGGGGGGAMASRNGGGGGGSHGGPRVKAVVVFAGGGSFAFAK